MAQQTIKISNAQEVRQRMIHAYERVKEYIGGGEVELIIQRPSKTRAMEKKYHALIGDISKTKLNGCIYSQVVWKAQLIVEFEDQLKEQSGGLNRPSFTVPSLRGDRLITIRASSAKFLMTEASEFIEFLYAYGTDLEVVWSEQSVKIYSEYREGQ